MGSNLKKANRKRDVVMIVFSPGNTMGELRAEYSIKILSFFLDNSMSISSYPHQSPFPHRIKEIEKKHREEDIKSIIFTFRTLIAIS